MSNKTNVKVLKFDMDDARDVIAYQALTTATGAKKKIIQDILDVYEKNKEEPVPEKIIYETIDDEKLRQILDEVVVERMQKFERKILSKIKNSKVVVDENFEEEEEEIGGFSNNNSLKSLVNVIQSSD